MSHVIGIDIGTSSIKVGIMDKYGYLTLINKQDYSLLYPKPGWIEIDVNRIWHKTKLQVMEAIEKINKLSGEVDAISLSTFCNSSVLIDKDGESITNGIMYLDQRSKKQADYVRSTLGEEKIYKITRNRIEPGMYSVTSLMWEMENNPNLIERTYKWGNLSTFILQKLTGKFVMDWTQASYTGMFNVIDYEWSNEICSTLGIDQSILPTAVNSFEIVGEFMNIPVVAGAADTASSSLSLGLNSGEIFESVGTSNVLTVATKSPDQLDTRCLNRCHVWENQWLSHGAMSTPGASIKWFKDNFLKEYNMNDNILEKLPLKSVEGSNGVYFLPYLQGERSPIWDTNARGVFAGIHLNTSKADLLRSILEGSAYGLRQITEIMERAYNLNFNRFESIGGGAKNKIWAQIKANILKKEIVIKEIAETGVFGSCIMAGKAVEYFSNFEHWLQNTQRKQEIVVKPNPNLYADYDKFYSRFCGLYPSLKEFFDMTVNK